MGFENENGREAIRFDAASVSGATAVDGYLLRFSVAYQVTPWREEFGDAPRSFRNFQAAAELGPDRVRLGKPHAERPLILAPHENEQPGALMFDLTLPTSTVEQIEVHRSGEGFEVMLRLAGERDGAEYTVEHDEVLFRISQSQWIEVLKQMDFGNYLLCEIPIELGDDGELREVWASMTLARELLFAGHYSNSVLERRKALETTLVHFELGAEIQSAAKLYRGKRDDRTSMSKRGRILNLINAANHVTQFGAHPDSNNLVVDYSRRETLLAFSVVAAAVAEISERPLPPTDDK